MTTKRLLTEAEILKMSDKDYMNEDQLAFFKNKLEQLQAEILRNAGQTTENLRETVIVPDPADRATIEEEHALELRTRDRARRQGRPGEEGPVGPAADQAREIWLRRGTGRADRRSAPARAPRGHALSR